MTTTRFPASVDSGAAATSLRSLIPGIGAEPTSRGGKWHPAMVDRLLRRLSGLKEELAKAGEAQQQEFLATQQELWATQKAGDPGLI